MKANSRQLILFSGLIWLSIGSFLMIKGFKWIAQGAEALEMAPLLRAVSLLTGSFSQATILAISLSLLVGFFKGRFVLSKTAFRTVARLKAETSPVPFLKIYTLRDYLIVGIMMGMGMLLRLTSIPWDIRGIIDITIGSALINGAMIYFREAVSSQKHV